MQDLYLHKGHVDGAQPIQVSFEFFPPKNDRMEHNLWQAIRCLEPLQPEFISVTYGAGGSTRERTHSTVSRIVEQTSMAPAAHLTCVAASRGEVDEVIRGYWQSGVRHIVALRGDDPSGPDAAYQAHPDGYQSTPELVAAIKKIGDFEVSVSAYPEKHPDSRSLDDDIDLLQAKVDAGADRAITQFFFYNDLYFRFLDRVRARGITIPITPGIVPIHNFKQIKKFAALCGTTVPAMLHARFEGLEKDLETRNLVAAVVAAEQVIDLARHGVRDFHFYTLNKARLVYAICHLLGLRPDPKFVSAVEAEPQAGEMV